MPSLRGTPGPYQPGQSRFHPPETASLFELRLQYQETLDTQFGRYRIPEERPFYLGLSGAPGGFRFKPTPGW